MKKILILAAIFSLTFSCKEGNKTSGSEKTAPVNAEDATLMAGAQAIFKSVSTIKNDSIPANKIELGKMLYFDKRLSKNNTIACNSCHNLETYGVDNQAKSTGDTKELGGRNSPSSLYAFLEFKQFWDGRAQTVEDQAKGPILNPVEHAIPNAKYLIDKLKAVPEYQTKFKAVYPDQADPITLDNIANAIGAFERQLHPASRFDKYLDGDNSALSVQEKQGLKNFMDSRCITCHNGITVGGGMFQKFGLFGEYIKETKSEKLDNGIADLTHNQADKFFFKVPSLRNVAKTYPYFHDGSVKDLKEAIRIMGKLQVNEQLSGQQIDNIAAFLNSLTAAPDPQYTKM